MTKTDDLKKSNFRIFLKKELKRRCSRNPNYSLRAFARFLEIDVSLLSKVLRAKHTMSESTFKKIARRMKLDEVTHEKFRRPLARQARRQKKGSRGN